MAQYVRRVSALSPRDVSTAVHCTHVYVLSFSPTTKARSNLFHFPQNSTALSVDFSRRISVNVESMYKVSYLGFTSSALRIFKKFSTVQRKLVELDMTVAVLCFSGLPQSLGVCLSASICKPRESLVAPAAAAVPAVSW
jgi:hypothetical protein